MRLHVRVVLVALASLVTLGALAARAQQQGPPPEVRAAIQSIVRMLEGTGDDSLRAFADERLAPAYRDSMSPEALLAHLRSLREATGGQVNDVAVLREAAGLLLELSGARDATILFDLDEQHRVTVLTMQERGAEAAAGAASGAWGDLTWESLAERFAEWEGFNGVVVAHRDGQEAMRAAYGFSDPATGRRTALSTIYGIGSTPIDFTVTGILLLAQRGQLALDDPLAAHMPGVPDDKGALTLRHLMTGASGLPDFHDRPKVDWDPDLAWIDRATAEQRILAQPLLFAPGAGQAHSHSAFGLLAAVIERVDGRTYPQFVRAEILAPLGMTRTGFYGERGSFAVEDFAVGAGPSFIGLPNIAPNWGPTSWLVMGSGGMYSTSDDMTRYYEALAGGRLLSAEYAQWQQGQRVGIGGSDRGFFIFHVTDGGGNSVLGLMNMEGRSPQVRAMLDAVRRLVFGR